MTKIVFMGTPAFSVPILEGLVTAGYTILAVVTQPDRPVGRKKVLTLTPVKKAAQQHSLEVLQPEKISGSKEMDRIIELQPDLIITAAFGQFLPSRLLQVPKLGAINVHASLLPKYRGGAPVHYSIMQGEKETGVTIMQMVQKMDAGDILTQRSIPITPEDNVGTMFEKLSLLGKELLIETLPAIIKGQVRPIPQKENEVSFSPNITREEEKIDWSQSAEQINCQVRGMYPWPVAYTTYQGIRWKILEATPRNERTEEVPGTIVNRTKNSLWIAAGENTILEIKQLQPAGKGPLNIAQFLNGTGQHIQLGEQVGK